MIDQTFGVPNVFRKLKEWPLGPYLESFLKLLIGQGYAVQTIREKNTLLAGFNGWLYSKKMKIDNLNEQIVEKYLKHRKRNKKRKRCNRFALQELLNHLRNKNVIPLPPKKVNDSVLHNISRDYEKYLIEERGLTHNTLINYLPVARHFLSKRFKKGEILFHKLCPHDATNFILSHARTKSPGRYKLMVTVLRSFFNYLRLRGKINSDLAFSLPTVKNWRLSSIPKSIKPEEVDRLLKSCNQNYPVGLRNYTILLILARLGLRAGEIVSMRLEDINWETGVLTIRGKGLYRDYLPLPHAVGETLAKYLRHGRPHCSSRKVFIRTRAPIKGFTSSVNISTIVSRALIKAGLNPAIKGAHLLRHSLATNMLRKGSTLAEIGEILRHRVPDTTQIYAKVDMSALHIVAQEWPGGDI